MALGMIRLDHHTAGLISVCVDPMAPGVVGGGIGHVLTGKGS